MSTEVMTQNEAPPVESTATALISVIERAARDPNVNIDKMERLLQMQERILVVQAKAEHSAAKTAALAEMPMIPKNGSGHNKMPYATLKDIVATTRPVLARHGLSLGWDVKVDGDRIVITAKLAHENGHEEMTSLPLPFDNSGSKNAVQAIGSSQTYGQRYTAQALLGLSLGDDVEDDGNRGGARETVSAEQYIKLRDTIAEIGANENAFLKYYKATSLETFPASKFNAAITQLDAKRQKEQTDGHE
jgi:hypothetical protein